MVVLKKAASNLKGDLTHLGDAASVWEKVLKDKDDHGHFAVFQYCPDRDYILVSFFRRILWGFEFKHGYILAKFFYLDCAKLTNPPANTRKKWSGFFVFVDKFVCWTGWKRPSLRTRVESKSPSLRFSVLLLLNSFIPVASWWPQ